MSTNSKAIPRFVPMGDNDINDSVAKDIKTIRKTLGHNNLLTEFLKQKGSSFYVVDTPAV